MKLRECIWCGDDIRGHAIEGTAGRGYCSTRCRQEDRRHGGAARADRHTQLNPREIRRRNDEQLGLFGRKPKPAPVYTPRSDLWVLGDGGIAPHSHMPKIPELDVRKLPKTFQGDLLRKMKDGDWILYPASVKGKDGKTYKVKVPKVVGKGAKAKWKWENPDPKVPSNKKLKTAIGGEKVGRQGKNDWLRGGLDDGQLQAIQFAAGLKGNAEKRALSLVDDNALYAISHSAGKDSQAMFAYLHRVLKIPAEQSFILHADLPGADWPSLLLSSGKKTPTLQQHMEDTVDGMPIRVVVAHWSTSDPRTPEHLRGTVKSFESVVRHQHARRPEVPSFPSKGQRWCTSDLKSSPLNRALREELCIRNGLTTLEEKNSQLCDVEGQPWRIVVSCEGLRGGESSDREKLEPWELDIDNCKKGRIWFTWLPIHDWTAKTDRKYKPKKPDVTEFILSQGQEPFWTYGSTPEHMEMIRERAPGAEHGVSRLSCQFCIFSSKKDQAITSQLDPDAYARMCALEKDVGSSVSMGGQTLTERTGFVPISIDRLMRRLSNPWTELGVGHPSGYNPDEEFSHHDLMLTEILAKGPGAPYRTGQCRTSNPSAIKRRLMGGGGRRERIAGGLAAGRSPSGYDAEQLRRGTEVEMSEHTRGRAVDRPVAEEIAMDHLTEDKAYYEKLQIIEGDGRRTLDTPWAGVVLVPRRTGDASLLESFEVVADGVRIGAVDRVRIGHQKRWAARTSRAKHDTDNISLEFPPDETRYGAVKLVLKRAKIQPKRRSADGLRASMGEMNPRLAELKRKLMR